MQYDPKLKMAMEEVKAILNKNDIAGFVILHSPGFSEYLNHVMTSYSCAIVTHEGVRLRLKSAEIGKEKAEQIANDTYNMVVHFSEHLGINAMFYMDAEKLLAEKLGGTKGKEGGHTSHEQQNN